MQPASFSFPLSVSRFSLSLTPRGAAAALLLAFPAAAGAAPVSYYKDVLPVFEAQCLGCHQPAKAKGDYVMTDFAKLLAGSPDAPAIVPGKPEESHLVKLITPGANGEAEMPQKKPALHPERIEMIKRWIAEGAVNDTPPNADIKYTAEHPPVYGAAPLVSALDWSPDGKWIAVSGFNEVLLHHADGSGLAARLVGLSERVESVAFSPDGALLAVAGGNPGRRGEIQVWDTAKHTLKSSHAVTFDTLYGVSWSPDGKFLAFGCGDHGDNSVRAIEVASGKEVLSNSAHGDWALGTAWSVDGKFLVSVGRDMAAKLTEVESQRFIDNITSITPGALRGGLHSVARQPQRDEVLLGGADGVPQIYRMQRQTVRVIGDDANLIRRYPALPGRIFGLAWRPDGIAFAAVSSHEGNGMLRTMAAEYDPKMPDDIKAIVQKVAGSETPEERKRLTEYITADTKILKEISFPGDRLFAVDWNPDGSQLAVAGSAGTVHIIDAAAGAEVKSFAVAPVDPAALVRTRPAAPVALPVLAKAGETPEPAIDPATVTALAVEPASLSLNSSTETTQLLVTAKLADGTTVDATRAVRGAWSAEVGKLDAGGLVTAAHDGGATLTLSLGAVKAEVPVTVKGADAPLHPDYTRDVMPVVSRLGCNMGTCHGSKDGRNGFKLSLRGYDPDFDVPALTDEQASRRANTAVPDSSFFLQKASAEVPHEGGQLTVPGEDAYEILRAWIADGGKVNKATPRVTGIQVFPQNPVVQQVGAKQQMRVVATYADGLSRDVTTLAFVDSGNMDVASAAPGGLVSTLRRGEAPVLARFEGAYAATTVTVMGDRTGFAWKEPESWSEIDKLVAAKWQRMKIEPSDLCTDAEFLRRIHLDLTGLPPQPEEVTAFLDDKRPVQVKRGEVIDKLIGSPAFVEQWTNKFADLLQVNGKFLAREGAQEFRDWIRARVAEGVPWDKFVHSVLTASGSNHTNPPAAYYKILRTPQETMENTTHLFLATRFNCNKCHDHPFERWTQDQYYQTSAWFARVELKPDPASNGRTVGGSAVEGAQPLFEITGDAAAGEVLHDRTKQVTPPDFPYQAKFDNKEGMTRREEFAAWMVSPDNRYFALSFVNRIWGYLLGTGLIEPLDDIRAGNPPSNPELLDLLRRDFIASGFDMRKLIKSICSSRTYQLSLVTNKWNEDDTSNFSHAQARRLPAEALYDSIMAVTGGSPQIPGVPPGTRAAALPDAALDLPSGFLANLGRPVRQSACECERSNDVQLGPVMSLLGGPVVADAIADPANAISSLTASEPDDRVLAEKLVLRVLNRPARTEEIDAAMTLKAQQEADHTALTKQLADAEVAWAPDRVAAEVKREENVLAATTALQGYEAQGLANEKTAQEARVKAIADAEAAVKNRDAELAAGIAGSTWAHPAAAVPEAPVWYPAKVVTATATGGIVLTPVPEDGSIVVTGPNVATDYTVEIDPAVGRVTGIVLEAMRDDRMPAGGPGRVGNGNFVLNQVSGTWTSLVDAAKTGPLEFAGVRATFTQGGFDPVAVIAPQPDAGKGWAIMGATPTRQSLAFALKAPLEQPLGARLKVSMKFAYPDNMHQLGRFRLWVTTAADPLPAGQPEIVKESLATVPPQRTPEQQAALLTEAGALDAARGGLQIAMLAARAVPVPTDTKLAELRAALAMAQVAVPIPPKIARLRADVTSSVGQMAHRRLTAAQDLVWALINSPEFLFNH